MKTGEGGWTIPANIRQSFHTLALDVTHGTVSLAPTAGAVPTNPVPAFVAETAAMWLDASVDASLDKRVEGDSAFVDNWYDVRETTPATPTHFYAKANLGSTLNGSWTYTALAPELKEKEGRPMIWFGGHSSSRSMSWFTPNGLLSCKRHEAKVRHVFVLRGAWDSWDAIVGAIPSLTSTSLDYTQDCPLLAPSQYGTEGGDGTYSTAYVDRWTRNSRLYENGVRVDPQTTKPCRGLALLDFSTLNEPFAANTFFNDRNLIGSTCPIYGGDRGGGEYIAEAIVFTNVLTESQRLQVEGYLMQKWLGTPAVKPVDLRLSSEATVEFASAEDVSASVTGNGRLKSATDDDVVFSSKDRTLPAASLAVGAGAVTLTKTMPLAVSAGDCIGASFTEDGPRVTRTTAAAGAFVKTGVGSVSLGEIGAGIQSFDIQGGRVTVRPKGADVIPARAPVPVALANPGFEDGWTENQKTSGTWWSWNNPFVSGWTVEKTFEASDGFAYYAPSGTCGPGTGWNLQVQPVEGDWFLLMRSGLRLSQPVTIPADGTYEVSFAWSSRPGYLGGQLDVRLESADQATTNAFGRVVIIQSDVFRTCRFRTQVAAGAYRLVFASRTVEDTPVILDDIHLAQVFPVEDGTVPVPGGDFEGAGLASASAMRTFTPGGTCDGWVLGEQAGPVTFLCSAENDTRVATGYLYNDSRRGSPAEGSVALALTSATSVSRTFRPPKGTWRLSAALDYIGENRSLLTASVTKAGGAVNLGACKAASHLMEDVVWPTVFETDGEEEITLTLTFDNSARPTEGMLVDDVRLVRASRVSDELVRNGDFEQVYNPDTSDPRQNWRQVKGAFANGDASLFAYSTGKEHWGYAEYDGAYRLKLCGDAYTYQTIAFPQAGQYRLSLHMSHRCEPDSGWKGYGSNPVRVWLTRGGAYTNHIAILTDYTTNYVQHVVDFAVPEAGEWDFALGGTCVGDCSSLVDGVSIRAIDVPEAQSPFGAEAEIHVAAGAKLDLSFVGTNRVQRIRLGNRFVSGVVNAETHPDFLQGFGSLYAEPRGSLMIVR